MIFFRQYLVFVYIISLFVDMFNGYCRMFLNIEPVFPLIYKGAIILFSLPYVLRQKKILLCFLIFALILSIDMVSWVVHSHLEGLTVLFNELIRLVYPFFVFSVVWYYRNITNKDELLHYAMYYGLFLSTSVCVTAFLGVGANSYGDDFGYGTKGLFTAGNDLSLSILLSFCICMYYLMQKGTIKYVLYSLPFIIVSLLIGSTAIMIGTIAILSILTLIPFVYRYQYSKTFYLFRYALLCLGLPLIIYLMYRITQTDSYTMNKFNVHKLLAGSARKGLADAYYAFSSTFDTADMIFGVGPEKLYYGVGYNFFGTIEQKQIEVDHLTLWGFYGYFLGTLILLYPLPALINYMRRWTLLSIWMVIALLLFFFHGIFAGHAYTSTTACIPLMMILIASIYQDNEYNNNIIYDEQY